MADTPGTRFLQTKQATRTGTDAFAQSSDGTWKEGDIPIWDANGGLTDSGVALSSLSTGGGGGGTGTNAPASLYGQVPRGPINGANTTFATDYVMVTPSGMAGPWSSLTRNGVLCYPPIDGPNLNTTFEYSINSGNASITFVIPPKVTDLIYISYLAGTATSGGGGLAPVSTATLHIWTSFTGGSSAHAFANLAWTYPPAQGGGSTVLNTNSFYALQDNTLSLTLPGSPSISSFAGGNITFQLIGSLLSIGDPNNINVYDIYITFALTDGSSVIVRPSAWSMYAGSQTGQFSWAPNTSYTTGTQVIDGNGNVQQAQSPGGTSSLIAPAWATSGNTTETTGLVWSFVGAQTSTSGLIQNPTLAFDSDSSPPTTFAEWTQSTWGGLVSDGYFTVTF